MLTITTTHTSLSLSPFTLYGWMWLDFVCTWLSFELNVSGTIYASYTTTRRRMRMLSTSNGLVVVDAIYVIFFCLLFPWHLTKLYVQHERERECTTSLTLPAIHITNKMELGSDSFLLFHFMETLSL